MSEGDKQTGALNHFELHRAVSCLGETTRVVRRSDGKVEVVMRSREGAQRLLNSDTLSCQTKTGTKTVHVAVRHHPTKGFAMGVITVPYLKDVEEGEILEELKDQGVHNVRRLQRRENGKAVPSDTLVLSFSQEELPSKVRVAWRPARVRPYIPEPVRCYNCQAYGHIASFCRGKERCARCSSLGHKSAACEAAKPKCVCGGDHEVWSRVCPRLQAERKKAKDKASRHVNRTAAPAPSDGLTPMLSRQSLTAPTPAPYRDALMGENHPPQEADEPCRPVSIVTSDAKMQDCMHLSLQQFLGLLNDHRCATQTPVAAGSPTRDVGVQCGVSDIMDKEVQTDALESQEPANKHSGVVPDTAVEETALDIQRRWAREAKRARLTKQARGAKQHPDSDSVSALDSGSEVEQASGTGTVPDSYIPPVSETSGTHTLSRPPIMAPPLLPPRRPPPLPPGEVPKAQPPPVGPNISIEADTTAVCSRTPRQARTTVRVLPIWGRQPSHSPTGPDRMSVEVGGSQR